MNAVCAIVATATQCFTLDGDLIVSEDDSALLEMVDDALAEELGTDGFDNAGEGVLAKDAAGERDPFVEPFEPNFAELLHEFAGLRTVEDAGVGDKDDSAEVVEGVATGARVFAHFKGTETSGKGLRVVGLIEISGHPGSAKPLDAVAQIYMPLAIDFLPSDGTLIGNTIQTP